MFQGGIDGGSIPSSYGTVGFPSNSVFLNDSFSPSISQNAYLGGRYFSLSRSPATLPPFYYFFLKNLFVTTNVTTFLYHLGGGLCL